MLPYVQRSHGGLDQRVMVERRQLGFEEHRKAGAPGSRLGQGQCLGQQVENGR